jgi:hypothetical protein
MTEQIRARQEAEQPPTEIEIMVTICDGDQRCPSLARVKADASWEQLMNTWRSQARKDHVDVRKFPQPAVAYSFRDDAGNDVSSTDGITSVSAYFVPAAHPAPPSPTISQAAANGTVSVLIIYLHLDPSGKYIRAEAREHIFPDETEVHGL